MSRLREGILAPRAGEDVNNGEESPVSSAPHRALFLSDLLSPGNRRPLLGPGAHVGSK